MKYDKETTDKLLLLFGTNQNLDEIASALSVPKRSIIAKLSSLGLYRKPEYKNKQGQPPIKKEEYVEKIATVLQVDLDILDSLEKCNKNVLKLLLDALSRSNQVTSWPIRWKSLEIAGNMQKAPNCWN